MDTQVSRCQSMLYLLSSPKDDEQPSRQQPSALSMGNSSHRCLGRWMLPVDTCIQPATSPDMPGRHCAPSRSRAGASITTWQDGQPCVHKKAGPRERKPVGLPSGRPTLWPVRGLARAGFIDSPPGAYTSDPSLAGRAFFGFVSRYEKGATVPTGRTAFDFRVAKLDFHATSSQWLVLTQAGSNAQFKGAGTINGQKAPNGQEYRFQTWATSGSPDTFRIKIWWEETVNGTVVERLMYDNGTQQAIEGGNILIQAK